MIHIAEINKNVRCDEPLLYKLCRLEATNNVCKICITYIQLSYQFASYVKVYKVLVHDQLLEKL